VAAPQAIHVAAQKPVRGAIEVKPPSHDVGAVAKSGQVLGYLEAYRQVLVTTLREFLKRVLTLVSPQDLAWFLASYAREARFLAEVAELPAFDAVRQSLETPWVSSSRAPWVGISRQRRCTRLFAWRAGSRQSCCCGWRWMPTTWR
jgi:hypothetical protein